MSSWEELKQKFINTTRRILERDLSKNPPTLRSQETDLFNSYNHIVKTGSKAYIKLDDRKKAEVQIQLFNLRDKLRLCIDKLGLVVEFSNDIFVVITPKDIIERRKYNEEYEPIETNLENLASGSSSTEQKTADQIATETALNLSELETSLLEESLIIVTEDEFNAADNLENSIQVQAAVNQNTNSAIQNQNSLQEQNIQQITNMPMTAIELVNLVSKQIRTKFSGDPLELQSFIRSVNLIVQLIEGETQAIKDLLPVILLTHLDKKALECVPTENATTQSIIEKLKENIKPDNSDVITGKMLALKLKNNLNEYSEQVESLSEALQRTLVIEGSSQAQAKKTATKTTIELCRNNARSDLMRSVMASSTFESPKDVLAKFIIENSQEQQEKQILAFKAHSNKQFNRGRGRGRNRYQQNYRNDRQNNNNNSRPKYFYNNNRGNYRGGQNRGRGQNYNRYNNHENHNVRMLGNTNIPQNAYLGAPQQQRALPQIAEL